MALVGEDDGGPPLVLATFHQGMDVVHQADVGHRQLVLVAILGEHAHLKDGHVGIRPELSGAFEEMRGEGLPGVQKCPKASAMSFARGRSPHCH
ncbi:MAG: hypothetical protein ACOYMG_13425 [Candidatus Methylumidiphilus sp.]